MVIDVITVSKYFFDNGIKFSDEFFPIFRKIFCHFFSKFSTIKFSCKKDVKFFITLVVKSSLFYRNIQT